MANKGSKGQTMELVQVTPELATEWLEYNRDNRKVKEASVDKYARDMTAGNWHQVGDPIRFETPDAVGDEFLLDGQNRLHAIVQSGTTQTFWVMRGLDKEAQTVIDSGSPRTVADTLTMEGWSFGNQLAAAARSIFRIDGGINNWSVKPTNAEVLAMIDSDPSIAESVEAVNKIWLKVRMRPVNAATCYYYGLKEERQLTQEFFTKLRTGARMDQGDPALSLLQRLNIDGRQLTQNQQQWVVLRAMNNARRGIQATRVQLPRAVKVGAAEICHEVSKLVEPRPTKGYEPEAAGE